MNFSEKILPNQDENKKLYTGSELFLDKLYSVVLNSCQLDDFDKEYSLPTI